MKIFIKLQGSFQCFSFLGNELNHFPKIFQFATVQHHMLTALCMSHMAVFVEFMANHLPKNGGSCVGGKFVEWKTSNEAFHKLTEITTLLDARFSIESIANSMENCSTS
jgi:hypothetical protein